MQGTPARGLRCSLVMGTVDETYKVGRLLASLDAQTHRNFELIVVDQNSDKRVAPILAPYKKKFPMLHIRSECKGLSKARNLGLQYVSGDIIAFPDDDCRYPPELLETVVQFFISHPEIDCLSGRSIDQDGKFSMGRFDLEA